MSGRNEESGRKILVVDDNLDSRELVVKILGRRGLELHEAADGTDALEQVALVRPDLILLDISLPGMDGYEVTRRLKQDRRFAAIPIIALTAHAMKGDREKALAAGCDDYIAKPIDIHTLYDRVVAHLR